MGMSINVVGFRPPDEQWEDMKEVWNACKKGGIPIPKEVLAFFEDEDPNGVPGKEVSLGEARQAWEEGMREGFMIDLEDLPPSIRYLRFYCSW